MTLKDEMTFNYGTENLALAEKRKSSKASIGKNSNKIVPEDSTNF